LACPEGYSHVINNSKNKINQTCVPCTPSSTSDYPCARCNPENLTQCLSCPQGSTLTPRG
jgi:hypothetical protein